jgi:heat shock protein HtpX
MCIDNPRVGFSNVFDTHPPVEARVEALVKFAGGHDPGRLAIARPAQSDDAAGETTNEPPVGGPWGGGGRGESNKPFLPPEPPVDLGGGAGGPWGPRRG